jgi:hypothetical protein
MQLLEPYPNVLTLRLRMPISDDLNPRNFLTKISKYERVRLLTPSVLATLSHKPSPSLTPSYM